MSRTRISRAVSIICGVFTAAVGLTALAGWIVEVEAFKTLFLGAIRMKTNAAIALTCLGLSLLILALDRRRQPVVTGIARLLAIAAGAIGLATLSQHLIGWDLGIDQFFFTEELGAAATTSPNRMGPPASLAVPLLACALVLIDYKSRTGRAAGQAFALVVMLIASIPLIGYVMGVEVLYGLARYTGIAWSTATVLLAMPIGILLARPQVGLMRTFLADDSGGYLLRRLVPAAILLPIVLGRVRLFFQDLGWYDQDFGRSLLVLSFIIAFTAITWWTGSTVQRHAHARERAEAAERLMHQRLLTTLESERHARTVAERSNRMKDDFLATLSHELRTPLQAMLGWLHVLRQDALDPADGRRGLDAIERNARLQAQLIEDLLDMSRIESGKVRLAVENVDVALVIESALAAAAPAAGARGLTLERRIDTAVRLVRGDAARLQQVLWNLISNALKFTPRGGRVTVALQQTAGQVELSVTDTGIGIHPEFLGHVFDRFRQADPSTTRQHGGLGLGLSIARHLTEMHGGTLDAASDGADRGATFTVRLPPSAAVAVDAAPPLRPRALDAGDAEAVPDSLAGTRVLVVDDQEDARELIARLLVDREASVTTVAGVDEAIDWLTRATFDVLVSDISMPGRDGYELIRHVRAHVGALPALALTAFARDEDEQRVLDAGFDRHVAKPVSPERLVAAVATLRHRPRESSVA